MWPEGPAAFSRHSPGKVQVPGFSDDDTYMHHAVVTKGARGLGVNTNPVRFVLNSLVRDSF